MKYQNRQLYHECQLVTIWNAARYYGATDIPEMGTEEYRAACEAAGALHGAATNTAPFMKKYGLERIEGEYKLSWLRNHLPAELSIHCAHGFHSVLAIEVRGSSVLVTNYAIGRTHWLPWKKLKEMSEPKEKPEQFVLK